MGSLTAVEHSILVGLVASAFVVARDCGGRRPEERVETLFHDRVAFARRLLQAGTIQYLNRSPTIADEARGLHRLRRKRHGFPIGAEYVREKFMRIRECFRSGPVVHHQQPSVVGIELHATVCWTWESSVSE